MKTIPAGITWHRLTNDTSIVTIRREPEVVYELTDFANQSGIRGWDAEARAHVCDHRCGAGHTGGYASGLDSLLGEIFGTAGGRAF